MAIPARPARNPEMLLARLADSPVRGLIVDLEADGAVALIQTLAGSPSARGVRVVAFGPHVAAEAFAAARAAGAQSVMARGAFSRLLPDVLRSLAAGGEVTSVTED